MAEGARLESVYAVTPYRGFESHSLRHLVNKNNNLLIIYPFYLHSYLQLITASVRPLHPEDVKKLRPQQIPLSQSHKKARLRRK